MWIKMFLKGLSYTIKKHKHVLGLPEAYVSIFFQRFKKSLGNSDNNSLFSSDTWLNNYLMFCFFYACSLRKFCCLQQYMNKRCFVADCHKFFYFIIILAWAKLMVFYFMFQDKQPCNDKYLNLKNVRLYFCCNSLKDIKTFWQLSVTGYSYNITNFNFMEKGSAKNACFTD